MADLGDAGRVAVCAACPANVIAELSLTGADSAPVLLRCDVYRVVGQILDSKAQGQSAVSRT
jgi:hypothetical protein